MYVPVMQVMQVMQALPKVHSFQNTTTHSCIRLNRTSFLLHDYNSNLEEATLP